jgi:hypothetical protein
MEIAACHNNMTTAFILYDLFDECFLISDYRNYKFKRTVSIEFHSALSVGHQSQCLRGIRQAVNSRWQFELICWAWV